MNFAGGFLINLSFHKMNFQESIDISTTLSTGSAITALIPSFFTVISIGIVLVATLSSEKNPGKRDPNAY